MIENSIAIITRQNMTMRAYRWIELSEGCFKKSKKAIRKPRTDRELIVHVECINCYSVRVDPFPI